MHQIVQQRHRPAVPCCGTPACERATIPRPFPRPPPPPPAGTERCYTCQVSGRRRAASRRARRRRRGGAAGRARAGRSHAHSAARARHGRAAARVARGSVVPAAGCRRQRARAQRAMYVGLLPAARGGTARLMSTSPRFPVNWPSMNSCGGGRGARRRERMGNPPPPTGATPRGAPQWTPAAGSCTRPWRRGSLRGAARRAAVGECARAQAAARSAPPRRCANAHPCTPSPTSASR